MFLGSFRPYNLTCGLFMFAVSLIVHTAGQAESSKQNRPHPITFSIPASKIVNEIPEKDLDFAPLIPGVGSTYIYNDEATFYRDYQRSYYAITCKKGGWDCMRHYEILANGCIPYFTDLDRCDDETMFLLPKDLIKEAMNIEGVSYLHIDHSKFDRAKYDEVLRKLLDYTRQHLTTEAMAKYILSKVNYTGTGKILFLSASLWPDYMRCLTLTGFRELLGDRLIDFPKVPHLYKNYGGSLQHLYGKGISYARNLDDIEIDRSNIEQRIKNKEFDLVIYGSIHRGLIYIDLVAENYPPEKIVYICGEDCHRCEYMNLQNFFLREFEGN